MTLDELQRNERLLMRLAFEKACAIAGLSLKAGELLDDGAHARIAAVVQIQVERGVSDLDIIAGNAAATIAENDYEIKAEHESPGLAFVKREVSIRR